MISATMELSIRDYVNMQEGQAVVAGTWGVGLLGEKSKGIKKC